jgi:hypothetical protein
MPPCIKKQEKSKNNPDKTQDPGKQIPVPQHYLKPPLKTMVPVQMIVPHKPKCRTLSLINKNHPSTKTSPGTTPSPPYKNYI